MSQFIESIKILDGVAENLDLHNARCNKARSEVLLINDPLDLSAVIKPPKSFEKGLVKCRIVYSEKIQEVTYQRYVLRKINSIRIIESHDIDYSHKFLDRSSLNSLNKHKGDADEILIINNGFVTDAYYYNVAFQVKDTWYTPKKPLLKGVLRTRLLTENRITEKDITMKDIKDFSKVSLFNALTPLGVIQLTTDKII